MKRFLNDTIRSEVRNQKPKRFDNPPRQKLISRLRNNSAFKKTSGRFPTLEMNPTQSWTVPYRSGRPTGQPWASVLGGNYPRTRGSWCEETISLLSIVLYGIMVKFLTRIDFLPFFANLLIFMPSTGGRGGKNLPTLV